VHAAGGLGAPGPDRLHPAGAARSGARELRVGEGDIVIRTDSGGKLAAATRGAVVAFEADSVDAAAHAGWSVTIVGCSRAVTDSEEIRRLQQIGLEPWAPEERDHFILISPSIVNGRRIGAQPLVGGSYASPV
jgi:hypothetical protein